jgi:hypothetical protein
MKMRLLVGFVFLLLHNLQFAWASDDMRQVDLSWDDIPGAKSYELELFMMREKKEVSVGKYATQMTQWSSKVKPGKYSIRLRALDARGVPGEWSETFPLKVKLGEAQALNPYQGEKVADPEVIFQWVKIKSATRYQLIVKDQRGSILASEITSDTEKRIILSSLGNYRWKVYAMAEDEELRNPKESDFSQAKQFERVAGELQSPEVKIAFRKNVVLQWDSIEHSTQYELLLLGPDGKGKRWELKRTSVQIPHSEFAQGESQIHLIALGTGYKESKKSIVKIIRAGDKFEGEVKENTSKEVLGWGEVYRKSIYRAALIFGSGQYSATNQASDTRVGNTNLSARGFQLDYWWQPDPKSYQYQFHLENIGYTEVNADSVELRATAHKTFKQSRGRHLIGGAGIVLKNWPQLRPNRFSNSVQVEGQTLLGPTVVASWQDAFMERHIWRADLYTTIFLKSAAFNTFMGHRFQVNYSYFWKRDQAFFTEFMMDKMDTESDGSAGIDEQTLDMNTISLGWIFYY